MPLDAFKEHKEMMWSPKVYSDYTWAQLHPLLFLGKYHSHHILFSVGFNGLKFKAYTVKNTVKFSLLLHSLVTQHSVSVLGSNLYVCLKCP